MSRIIESEFYLKALAEVDAIIAAGESANDDAKANCNKKNKEACLQVSEFFTAGEIVPKDLKIAKAWKTRAQYDETEISPPLRR